MSDVGVVLDFDGTLIRSMELHAEAYRRVLRPYGIRFSDQDIFDQEGARSETIIREQLERNHVAHRPEDVARLARDKQQIFLSLGPPALYAGSVELVEGLRRRFPRMAMVTGTLRANLDRLAPQLLPHFTALVTQEDYHHDKPHPEPFLTAAVRLGLAPERLAVLENAVRGVRAARAAGCGWVVGITTTMSGMQLERAGAHAVARSPEEALIRLTQWADRMTASPARPGAAQ